MASITGNTGQTGRKTGRSAIQVENDEGRLRLRFSHGGKRYCLALGLYDSVTNRTFAQQRVAQIELDIISGNFDATLKKYKPQRKTAKQASVATAGGLFEKFMQEKAKVLHAGSLRRYDGAWKHLDRYFQDRPVESINVTQAEAFTGYLQQEVSLRTVKDYLTLAQECWRWAAVKYELEQNPWTAVLPKIKPPPKQKVQPFTADEVRAILAAFRSDRHYSQYADFVTFLFGTGCRFGEVAGLKWKHVSSDYSQVWIGESITRGVKKTTKTGKARVIVLTQNVASMLQARKPSDCNPESLVFHTPQGLPMNDRDFRRRAWKKILTSLGIDYRKPYSTRHTAISHALEKGANPLAVADATGHDPQTLFKHYASVIQRSSVMVDFQAESP